MKRTLIVATTSYAGMGPYVSEIVNSFHAEDDVFFFFREYDDEFFRKNVKKELHDNSVFYRFPISNWNKIKYLLFKKLPFHDRILDFCREKNIQVVHFINGPGNALLVKDLKIMGVVPIGTVHDLHPHESDKEWYKEIRNRINNAHGWDDFLAGKYFITNDMSQYEEISHSYPDKKVFYHVFPSLVTKSILEGKDVPPELKNISKPYILFFGRIEKYKGISLLYEVFTRCSDLYENFHLVVAGSGTLPFSRIQNERNVIWMNRYVKDSEIAYLYEHAHCVVYPYLSATQSGVLSLAFYYGVPTLTSDVPFFRSIIEPTGAGVLFKVGDSTDLENKLKCIVNSNRKVLVEKEHANYTNFYMNQTIREVLLEIYGELTL